MVAGGSGDIVRKTVHLVNYNAKTNSITLYTNSDGLYEACDTICATTITVKNIQYAVFAGGWIDTSVKSKYINILKINSNTSAPTRVTYFSMPDAADARAITKVHVNC